MFRPRPRLRRSAGNRPSPVLSPQENSTSVVPPDVRVICTDCGRARFTCPRSRKSKAVGARMRALARTLTATGAVAWEDDACASAGAALACARIKVRIPGLMVHLHHLLTISASDPLRPCQCGTVASRLRPTGHVMERPCAWTNLAPKRLRSSWAVARGAHLPARGHQRPIGAMCGRGGTGRRATLRSLWPKGRGSSSLLDRTTQSPSKPKKGLHSETAAKMAQFCGVSVVTFFA